MRSNAKKNSELFNKSLWQQVEEGKQNKVCLVDLVNEFILTKWIKIKRFKTWKKVKKGKKINK